MTYHQDRRRFLQSSAAAAISVPGIASVAALGFEGNGGDADSGANKTAANDRIQIGLIGAGGMGRGNLNNCAAHADVAVTGVCDVWKERRDAVVTQYPTAKPYSDYRQMLASPEIDAVIIATPPHWHCLQAVDACAAGKDLYLQKPMTLHLNEGIAVKRAVEKHGRICQVGTQIHAGDNYRRIVELVQSGNLGKISVARTFNVMNQGINGLGNPPDTAPPKGLDWEQWVGPGPMRSYNRMIVQSAYENCSFMDYSGGWTPGMAPHIIDLPYWALDLGFPTKTSCTGGRFTIRDLGDTPDIQEVHWQYPEMTLAWSMSMVNSFGFDFGRGERQRRLGVYLQGVNGTLIGEYGKHEVVAEGDWMDGMQLPEPSIPPSPGHEREWLNCIKSRQQPSCNPAYHYKIDGAINLANLSMRVGRTLEFDPATETIVDDPEAARLATPEYRGPWKFPKSYLG